MAKKITIKLNTMEDVLEFVYIASSIKQYICCGQDGIAVNPKHLKSVMELDISKPIIISIYDDINNLEILKFNRWKI